MTRPSGIGPPVQQVFPDGTPGPCSQQRAVSYVPQSTSFVSASRCARGGTPARVGGYASDSGPRQTSGGQVRGIGRARTRGQPATSLTEKRGSPKVDPVVGSESRNRLAPHAGCGWFEHRELQVDTSRPPASRCPETGRSHPRRSSFVTTQSRFFADLRKHGHGERAAAESGSPSAG